MLTLSGSPLLWLALLVRPACRLAMARSALKLLRRLLQLLQLLPPAAR